MGLLRESAGQFDLAVAEYEAALAGVPADERGALYGYLGNAHAQAGHFHAAQRAYRRALRADPHDAPILNNLAHAYSQEGEHLDEAALLVHQAMALDPTRMPVYLDTLAAIRAARAHRSPGEGADGS